MSNNLVTRIDLVHVNEDGTIDIIDTPSWHDYPFTFQYKLYLSFEENLANIFRILFENPPSNYEFTPRFQTYIENRKIVQSKITKEYLPIVNAISQSGMSIKAKQCLIHQIDLELNQLYPYKA